MAKVKKVVKRKVEAKRDVISFRLKCAKSSNGLSHYLMYGDNPEKRNIL